jgi:hypothetical protein
MPKASTSTNLESHQAAIDAFFESLIRLMQRAAIPLAEWDDLLREAPHHELWWSKLCSWVEKNPPPFTPALKNKSTKGLIQPGWAWREGSQVVVKRQHECAEIQVPPERLKMVFFFRGHEWGPCGYLWTLAGHLLGLPVGDSMEDNISTESVQARLIERIAEISDKAQKVIDADPLEIATNREFKRRGISLNEIKDKATYEKARKVFLEVQNEHVGASQKVHVIAGELVESCQTIKDYLHSSQSLPAESLWALKAAINAGKLSERLKLESDFALCETNTKGATMSGKKSGPLRTLIDQALLALRTKLGRNPKKNEMLEYLGMVRIKRISRAAPLFFQMKGKRISEKDFDTTFKNAKR